MFKVGEIALTQHCIKKPNNVEVEIIATPEKIKVNGVYGILFNNINYLIAEANLKKLPPPNTPDTWQNCIWKPSTINAVSNNLIKEL